MVGEPWKDVKQAVLDIAWMLRTYEGKGLDMHLLNDSGTTLLNEKVCQILLPSNLLNRVSIGRPKPSEQIQGDSPRRHVQTRPIIFTLTNSPITGETRISDRLEALSKTYLNPLTTASSPISIIIITDGALDTGIYFTLVYGRQGPQALSCSLRWKELVDNYYHQSSPKS